MYCVLTDQQTEVKMVIVGLVTGAAGAVGAMLLAPYLLPAIGFTSAGISAGSYAAGMMSSAAAANGGGVAAGSLVSVLQSAGAVGLSAGAKAVAAAVGGSVGTGVGSVWTTLKAWRRP